MPEQVFDEDDFDEEAFWNAPPPDGAGDLVNDDEFEIELEEDTAYEDDVDAPEAKTVAAPPIDIDETLRTRKPKIRATIKLRDYYLYQKWYAVASVTDQNDKPFKVDRIHMELRRGEGEPPVFKHGKNRWQLKFREERWNMPAGRKVWLKATAKWRGKTFSYETRRVKHK